MHGRGFDPTQKFDKNTFKRLLKYMSKYKLKYFIVIICIIISSIVQIAGHLFLRTLIDDYIVPLSEMETPVYTGLLQFLGMIINVYVFGIICSFLYNRIMISVAQGVLKNIRDDMFNHMQTLPISYFDNNTHGDIMSRYTNDTDSIEMMISQSLPGAFGSIVSIISIFISMLTLNVPLTFAVVIGVIAMVWGTKNVIKKSGNYFVKTQDSLGKLNGFIEEMIDGQKVIKVFTHEEEAKNDFVKLNNSLFKNASNANAYGNMVGPITNNVSYLIYVIVALLGGILAIKEGTFTLGAIASFLTLTHSFTRPIMQVTSQLNMIVRAMAGANRVFKLMDEKEEENSGKVKLVNAKYEDGVLVESDKRTEVWAWKNGNELTLLQGDIRLNNVSFSYVEGKEVIHDISLYAKPGQKIAFVGATGAGKTTISNLINRFYDINKGTITYDGIDIMNIDKKDLRRSLGMVLQDTNLFTGTILDNIRYGRSDATREECIEAAKLANADGFINLLPDGYDTVISGNGSNLSQGERQLLAIARCAVADPPAMILDEATSSIDTRTEKIVQDGMDKLMQGRTVLVIAHRLSTIQNAKAIMVMENGRIIERGEHEDLLKEKGRYYELYTGSIELD